MLKQDQHFMTNQLISWQSKKAGRHVTG